MHQTLYILLCPLSHSRVHRQGQKCCLSAIGMCATSCTTRGYAWQDFDSASPTVTLQCIPSLFVGSHEIRRSAVEVCYLISACAPLMIYRATPRGYRLGTCRLPLATHFCYAMGFFIIRQSPNQIPWTAPLLTPDA